MQFFGFFGCEPLGGGAESAPLLLSTMSGLPKKYEVSIFSMGNLEQILISVYPSKNYSKYPKSTLEHKWFLSKMLFCHSSVLRNLRFLAKKTLRSRKKRPSTLVLFDFRQLLFYDVPPKNASKYHEMPIFRFANTVIFKIWQL